MKKHSIAATGLAMGSLLFFGTACKKDHTPEAIKDFTQVNLVANNHEYNNPELDTSLLNAWGLAFGSSGTAWVSSPGGHVSTVYDKDGKTLKAPVSIPSPGGPTGGNPTGIVFNSSTDFVLSNGQPALFVFVGVDGVLSGWNPAAGNKALLVRNNVASAAYTGLALSQRSGANFLYAANFRTGRIDVWDKNFRGIELQFVDPNLPAGYSPYNIQAVGKWLYVTYAKVGPNGRDLPGAGNGFVNIFSPNGDFIKRLASNGTLNAPWGIVEAPASFFDENSNYDNPKTAGKPIYSNNAQPVLLVGNFGDGKINAFTEDGQFVGQLMAHGHSITIPGLWALSFPPATATGIDPNRLYFTAGPDNEQDGLFGYLIKQ